MPGIVSQGWAKIRSQPGVRPRRERQLIEVHRHRPQPPGDVGHRQPGRDHAQAGILRHQLLHQRLQRGILQLPRLRAGGCCNGSSPSSSRSIL